MPRSLTWGNPTLTRLEDQALVPMYGDAPGRARAVSRRAALLARLRAEPAISGAVRDGVRRRGGSVFTRAIVKALAAFERTIVSARSPYDRYHYDRDEARDLRAARRGEMVFLSRPLSCFRCHGGFTIFGRDGPRGAARACTSNSTTPGSTTSPARCRIPPPNTGVYEVTHKPEDVGKFKAPTLRNIAVTAPYMHDGSVATLEDAIAHYAAGGRTIAEGPNRGVGHDNPNKSPIMRGFRVTAEQRADLVAFLSR